MKNIIKKGVIALLTLAVMVFSMPASLFAADTTSPTISIGSASSTTVSPGGTVSYNVGTADDGTLVWFGIESSDIMLNGFSANISITKTGTWTRTITFSNVQSTDSTTTKYFTIASGVSEDEAGNKSVQKSSPAFKISAPADTTAPTISISAANPTSIYAGSTVVYTIGVADDTAITSYSISSSNITLHGFTANISVTGSGLSTRTVTLTNIQGTVGGSKYITVDAGVARDAAGNTTIQKSSPAFSIASTPVTDTTAPSISISAANPTSIYAGGTVAYTVTVSDNVGITSFTLSSSDIMLNGFTANMSITGSGNTRTVTLTNVQGTVGSGKYITIDSGVARDAAGNTTPQKSSTSFSVESTIVLDLTAPTISISAANPTSIYAGGTVAYTVTVSDNVGISSFTLSSSDIMLNGFTANMSITGSGNTRTVTLTSVQGTVGGSKSITVDAGVARDAAGNTTPQKSSTSFSIIAPADTTAPTIVISAANPSSIYAGGTVAYTVTVSDDIGITSFTLSSSDIMLNGFTANISITGTGNTRTVTLTNVQGTVGGSKYITINGEVARDAAGNKTIQKSSPAFSILAIPDTTAPTISISAANPTSIYAGGTVAYTVTVSDNVGITSYTLSASDIMLNGFTANISVTGSGNTRTVTLTNVQGTVGGSKFITVDAGVARDAAGNTTPQKSSTSFSIIAPADTTSPTIVISGANPLSIYSGGTVSYAVTVSDDIGIASYTLSASDIMLNGFTATVTVTGSGNTRTVTLTNIKGNVGGSKYITVAAGVARDAAYNTTIQKSSPAFSILADPDTTAPTISISGATPISIYAGSTVVYTVGVADDIGITSFTLSASDIMLNGFTANISVTGSGNTRTITLTNVQGTVGGSKYITIASGVARDAAGNKTIQKSSPAFSIIKNPDTTPPTISITGPSDDSIYVGQSVTYRVYFADNEGIARVDLVTSDIALHGFTADISISGTGTSSRLITLTNIRGTVGGGKYITVASGAAVDTSENKTPAISSNSFAILKDPDNTPPTIIIDGPNNLEIYAGESVRYTVTFMDNEGIASINLTSSNIILNGFTANISVTGSGNTRTVNLTNVQGTVGGNKYITVKAGAATDTSGNNTPAANSDKFAIIVDKDTTPPTISIIGPVPDAIYNGETVAYRVYFNDNEGIEDIILNTSNIVLNGFTATVKVTGTGNSRVITLMNVQGTIGGNKYITIKAGAATDTSGNKTLSRSSNDFRIMQRPVIDSKAPVVRISVPNPSSIYAGGKVTYTVTFTDDTAVTAVNLTAGKITLHGFTATVKVTGSGLAKRTVTLTNIKGVAGVNKYITIASGVALDVEGNRSAMAYSPRFTIKEKKAPYVKPTKIVKKSYGTCIDDLKLLGDINKEITYFASWLRAEKYTASYVQENNYVAENERMTYMVEYYNGSTAPTPDVNFELTIPYKVIVEEINGNGRVTKATEDETVVEWNLRDIKPGAYCRLYVRVKFLENKTLEESENISETFFAKLKTTASGNTSYSYMRELFIDTTEGKTGTYTKYLTSIDTTNSIRPDDEVTRAEFAKMLADAGIVKIAVGSEAYKTFKDADKIPAYARDAVSALVGTDIIQAFSDGEFKPNNPILVEDAMEMIAQASRYISETKLSIYKPVFLYTDALTGTDKLVSPKKDYIMELMRQNVVVKYASNPDTYALRKDVVKMVNALTFRGPYVEKMPEDTLKFADIREDSVYFYNIIGASNTYTYSYDYRLWQEILSVK